MTVPMAQGPVLWEAARTMFMLSSAVVYPRPTGIMVMNRAADGRVQQRGIAAAVYAAQWVVVHELRRALKDGFAGADLDQ